MIQTFHHGHDGFGAMIAVFPLPENSPGYEHLAGGGGDFIDFGLGGGNQYGKKFRQGFTAAPTIGCNQGHAPLAFRHDLTVFFQRNEHSGGHGFFQVS